MPGVRPVGIGESTDRCFEKIMTITTGSDVMEICGSDQLCSGIKSGIEGAIHAISQKFNEHCHEGWGLLLTDAENAFNSISRPVFLWNARIFWTRCSRFLFNSYRGYAILVLRSSSQVHYLFSKEGCTQGSGCAMQAYAIGILPLIRKLKNSEKWTQNWYADDGSCLGGLANLVEWLKLLDIEGPKHGYYNEISKMVLVVAPQFLDQAKEIFKEFGLKILTGHRLLGGFIGSEDEKVSWVMKKNDAWTECIKKISRAAKYDPQSAFIAVSKSLQNEWNFIQRVVDVDENLFGSLKEAICQTLLPQICGFEISNLDADMMLRPARFGGIGIRDPIKSAAFAFRTSYDSTSILKDAVISGQPLDLNLHQMHSRAIAQQYRLEDERQNSCEVEHLIQNMPVELQDYQRQLQRITKFKCSSWLTVNPSEDEYFSLTPDEFRDSMACRYGKIPKALQPWCDGCGERFDVNHALNCKNGGLVYQRHNEMRDENCDLNRKAGFSQVISEPIVKEAEGNGLGELRGDWSVRGFWVPQRVAVFDTRIFNANAPSYKTLSLDEIFDIHRNQKKQIYASEVEHRRGSFTPVLATCEGILDREVEAYAKRLAQHLSRWWEKNYSQTVFWVRARIQICILRSVSNCFRGSRSKWKGGNIEDGAGIPNMNE